MRGDGGGCGTAWSEHAEGANDVADLGLDEPAQSVPVVDCPPPSLPACLPASRSLASAEWREARRRGLTISVFSAMSKVTDRRMGSSGLGEACLQVNLNHSGHGMVSEAGLGVESLHMKVVTSALNVTASSSSWASAFLQH